MKISQAVILSGGRGTRLSPLTDLLPKPMLPIHGRPFLEYLVEDLREEGVRRILLLLGYRSDAIMGHFGDGSRFGVEISYKVSDVDDETGRRISLASPAIEPLFLLMYCDNYWPLRLKEMWQQFEASGVPGQITVYNNSDAYTRGNVIVGADGRVVLYDKTRAAPGLTGVDIGYAILRKEVLSALPGGNPSFEATVFPELAGKGMLGAYRTDHRYYSIGSIDRLPATEKFLRREPAILIDRDGVLNRKAPRAEYIKSWAEFEWLPGAKEALALLRRDGCRVIVVTNQAGIARGCMTEADLHGIHVRMVREAEDAGGRVDAVYYCPHGWDDGCSCRKPRPGMLFRAQRDFALDLTRTWFVGDDERDEEAGRAAGCPTALVSGERSVLDVVRDIFGIK